MRFNVITIKWGKRYGPEYVNRLYGSVKRNLSREFRFVCFTDDAEYIRPEVETYPIPNGINPLAIAHFSHGKKQELFHSGVGDLIGTSLYFDLDVIIVDSIDCFFNFKPGEFCVCREWLPPHQRLQYKLAKRKIGGNTSVFRFEANSLQFVIDMMNNKPHLPRLFNLEQRWLSHALEGRMNWWPSEWVTSFKHRKPYYPFSFCLPPVLPRKARVVVFNGPLKPSDAINGSFDWSPRRVCRPATWAAENWVE